MLLQCLSVERFVLLSQSLAGAGLISFSYFVFFCLAPSFAILACCIDCHFSQNIDSLCKFLQNVLHVCKYKSVEINWQFQFQIFSIPCCKFMMLLQIFLYTFYINFLLASTYMSSLHFFSVNPSVSLCIYFFTHLSLVLY